MTPQDCPRHLEYNGTSGPRRCGFVDCRQHLKHPTAQGPTGKPSRARLAMLVEDTCALDVAERVHSAGLVPLAYRDIAVMLGCDPSSVARTCRNALRKVRKHLDRAA